MVIPAAGESRRFAEAGYRGPKCQLMLSRLGSAEPECALNRILATIPENWEVIVVYHHQDQFNWFDWEPLYSARKVRFTRIRETRGQSDTIRQALNSLTGPVIVHNSDVVFREKFVHEVAAINDDVTAVHLNQTGPEIYSYVQVADGRAYSFYEKSRVTSLAQSGLWRFRSGEQLRRLLENQVKSSRPEELYLSEILHDLDNGMLIKNAGKFLDLGTPEAVAEAGFTIG